ncbi:MAG TPA: NADH-quinone oxidoreductase subunit L [Aggregatilinea sp.]|jgi:multicomponent Na+:H+ antiporter subunit A|uniref:NADH-quinone oxidoreductase subunit 5 family protein n=1 Tax=Aggregatilinea sp. TaxID=2806333 RepID=UPI002C25A4A3|nr:NADH-quinone oxidoreductase subunit L [Aggregatilinea sp.]HML22461.1 NADH-quinone oxidoreductase subunit L [Aggregatilinea sp.]
MTIPLIVLLAGVVLQIALARVLTARSKGWLAFLSGLAALAAALALIPTIRSDGSLDGTLFTWDQNVPVVYHVDALSLVFMLLATGVGSAILLYCVDYMADEPGGVTRFYALILTFIAGMVNLVCSSSLLIAYFSWEVIGLCSYFLVGFWYKETAAANGARKVLLMTHIAGYGFLAAVLLLFHSAGTFLWTDPALGAAFSSGIFLLLLIAAMAKSVIFPLHTWIPEAMNAPTPVSALLHSACYVKAGVYLIARLYAITPWQPEWKTLVLALGCATMLVGALFALVQTDLKRLLAYSTISQLGYIVTGLGLGTPIGLAAGLFYALSHGLFKGTLFLCAGSIQHATGTRDLRKLGGLAQSMPQTARIWLIAAAAIIGVPLTNGFAAKWLFYDAALDDGALPVVIIALLVSTVTAFYMLKATVGAFYGEPSPSLAGVHVHEAGPTMRAGMWTLAALSLLFGIAPQILMKWIVAPAVTALGFTSGVETSWLGLSTGSGSAQATGGAILVLAALGTGYVIYRLSQISPATAVNAFSGGDPLPEGAPVTLTAEDFSDFAGEALGPVYAVTDPDRVYLRAWQGLRSAIASLDSAVTPRVEAHPLALTAGLAILVGLLVWIS